MNATENQNRAVLLDRAAAYVRLAQEAAALAQAVAISRPEKARELSGTASDEADRALNVLCDRLGATIPGVFTSGEPDAQKPLDLRELASLDTPTARELLTLLQQATACAERLDAERGRVLPAHIETGEGETRGVDFAESVGELTQRLRSEIFGAKPGRE